MNTRPLNVIAREIRQDWKNISPYAEPYVEAMSTLTLISDRYFYDSGRGIVLYFLANAGTWRGETARRIKTELKEMLQ